MCEIIANRLISNCSFINDLIMTTCYPTVRNVTDGNSGDKMSKEYFECSGKG